MKQDKKSLYKTELTFGTFILKKIKRIIVTKYEEINKMLDEANKSKKRK